MNNSANWVITASDNGLVPVRHQAITWTNEDSLPTENFFFCWNINQNIKIVLENVYRQNYNHLVKASMQWVSARKLHLSYTNPSNGLNKNQNPEELMSLPCEMTLPSRLSTRLCRDWDRIASVPAL